MTNGWTDALDRCIWTDMNGRMDQMDDPTLWVPNVTTPAAATVRSSDSVVAPVTPSVPVTAVLPLEAVTVNWLVAPTVTSPVTPRVPVTAVFPVPPATVNVEVAPTVKSPVAVTEPLTVAA